MALEMIQAVGFSFGITFALYLTSIWTEHSLVIDKDFGPYFLNGSL